MYRQSSKGWLKHADFLIIDILSLEVSFLLAVLLRHHFTLNVFRLNVYQAMFFMAVLFDLVGVAMLRTLSGVLRRGYYEEFKATLKHVVFVTILAVLFLYAVKRGQTFSRTVIVLTTILYLLIGYATRVLWKRRLKNKVSADDALIILISKYEEASLLVKTYLDNNYTDTGIKGLVIVDRSIVGETIENYPVLADRETVEEYVRNHWVDEVLFGLSVHPNLVRKLEEVFLEMGITVHQSIYRLTSQSQFERKVERIGGYTVLTRSIIILSAGEQIMKRLLDIIGGLIGSIIAVILMILVGPTIYIASPGPIIFTQTRIGQNGKYFKMYKLRSMYLDAEERKAELMAQNNIKDGHMFKIDNDPRIIGSEKGPGKGIGNFIRRTSIDEFPQFFNVLKGDMSLVGTRPPTIDEWEKYENHHRARMATKPGITGMWQVSGRSDITDFEEVVKLDMEYIENWSFGLDIKILFKTVLQVLKHEGAK